MNISEENGTKRKRAWAIAMGLRLGKWLDQLNVTREEAAELVNASIDRYNARMGLTGRDRLPRISGDALSSYKQGVNAIPSRLLPMLEEGLGIPVKYLLGMEPLEPELSEREQEQLEFVRAQFQRVRSSAGRQMILDVLAAQVKMEGRSA